MTNAIAQPVSRYASRLPSIVGMAEDLHRSLDDKSTLLIAGPSRAGSVEGVRDAFKRVCFGSVFVHAIAHDSQPARETVARALALGNKIGDLLDLGLYTDSPDESRVLWISFDHEPAFVARKDWKQFLLGWIRAAKTYRNLPKLVVEVTYAGLCEQLFGAVAEPTVVEIDLWKRLSIIDVRLACREADAGNDEIEAAWREVIVPEVAGTDLELADAIWEPVCQSAANLERAVRKFAMARWPVASELASAMQRIPAMHSPTTLAPEYRRIWMEGLFDCTHEHGLERSVAARFLLNEREELDMRLWRGASMLVVPLIDRVRRMMMTRLADHRGSDWRERVAQPTQDQQVAMKLDPRNCDIGYLEFVLKEDPEDQASWLPLASKAAALRNALAHFRPIEFKDYRDLRLRYRRWRQGVE